MEIDPNAYVLAYKILLVIFILITIFANAGYLIKYLRAPRAMHRAGHYGKISLALGSIFLALFPYVVWAKAAFEGTGKLSCRTVVTAANYQFIFFPFVFGFTIFSSSLTLFLSQHQICTLNASLVSMMMAAFPWLLGLLVICPLVFSGMDLDGNGCDLDNSWGNITAALGIGILLSAIVALLFCIAMNVMIIRNVRSQQSYFRELNVLTENELIPDTTTSTSHQTPYAQQEAQLTTLHGESVSQTTAPAASAYLMIEQVAMEQHGLLWGSVIFFFSVVPFSLYILGYYLNDGSLRRVDNLNIFIIQEILVWISFLYPVLVPIVWQRQVQ